MNPSPPARSILPVLYVGRDVTPPVYEVLRARRIGLLVACDAVRAQRVLKHFRVAAIVFAAPDLPGLSGVTHAGVPIVVLAGRDAACDLDGVTILRRETDPEELAAVIHGLLRCDLTPEATRDAA
jgi:hypothetical protein